MPTKISLISLGCPKNLVDSEAILSVANNHGYQIVPQPEKSDITIVNTCGFIESSKKESLDVIFELIHLKKTGTIKKIIVTGCLPQRYQKDLEQEIPEVDAWLGIGDFSDMAKTIEAVLAGEKLNKVSLPNRLYPFEENNIRLTPPHYAYIKIAEGCDNNCTYCAIPLIRGKYRSRPIPVIMKEIENLLKKSPVKEINLISQDTTSYGADIYGEQSLIKLLKEICALRKIPWIRLLYNHPAHFTDELIEAVKNEHSICKYIDLPLQHINNTILTLMDRQASREDITSLMAKLRKNIPGLAIRTSFIVGFPGEGENEFKELYNFIKEAKFERLGVFTYSQEEDTRAYYFENQVPEEVKDERFNKIMELQQGIAKEVNAKFLGKTLDVLIDEVSEDDKHILLGRTQYDAPEVDGLVYVKAKTAKPGDLVKVKMTDTYEYDLVGDELT